MACGITTWNFGEMVTTVTGPPRVRITICQSIT
jgi:hypothetical protein